MPVLFVLRGTETARGTPPKVLAAGIWEPGKHRPAMPPNGGMRSLP